VPDMKPDFRDLHQIQLVSGAPLPNVIGSILSTRELAPSNDGEGGEWVGVGVRRTPGLERFREIVWTDKV